MLNGNRIIFVAIVDNKSQSYKDMSVRLWPYQKMVNRFLKIENCVMGRATHELTRWKGSKSWVLTRDIKWKSLGIGTIHNIEDFHLWMDGDIYILGGNSIFKQLEPYVDEIHLYVFNSSKADTNWIKIDMKEWNPVDYANFDYWSYANLQKSIKQQDT